MAKLTPDADTLNVIALVVIGLLMLLWPNGGAGDEE